MGALANSSGLGPRPAILAALALAIPSIAQGQSNPNDVPREESAFVVQAPDRSAEVEPVSPREEPAASKVYFPDEITPESVAEARARAAQQQQLEQRASADPDLDQVSSTGEGARDVAQLSDGDSARALAQLSAAEQQVLLEAVEGTDICERSPDIPALQALCESRIETRSAEFARQDAEGSAEDNLLGGGLDADRVATLEAAIARLARNAGDSGNFSNQVIASVALGSNSLSDSQATSAEGQPGSELSAETQALVAAIVQQLGGN